MRMVEFEVPFDTGTDHYIQVRVFPSSQSMRRAYAKYLGEQAVKLGRDCRGLFCSQERVSVGKDGKSVLLPQIGTMYLIKSHLGVRVVGHEATHAAIELLRRRKIAIPLKLGKGNWLPDADEELCYAVGNLTAGIYNALRERKLIED